MADILNSYRFRGKLGRFRFILSFLTFYTIFACLAYALRRIWVHGAHDGFMITSMVLEILIPFLLLPLCAARLSDIGWPRYLSGFVLLSLVFSPRQMTICALNSWGIISTDYYCWGANVIGGTVLLFFLFLLVFLKGAPDKKVATQEFFA